MIRAAPPPRGARGVPGGRARRRRSRPGGPAPSAAPRRRPAGARRRPSPSRRRARRPGVDAPPHTAPSAHLHGQVVVGDVAACGGSRAGGVGLAAVVRVVPGRGLPLVRPHMVAAVVVQPYDPVGAGGLEEQARAGQGQHPVGLLHRGGLLGVRPQGVAGGGEQRDERLRRPVRRRGTGVLLEARLVRAVPAEDSRPSAVSAPRSRKWRRLPLAIRREAPGVSGVWPVTAPRETAAEAAKR